MRNLVSRLSSTSVSKITSASRVLNEKIKHVFGNKNDINDDWGKPVGGTFGGSSSDDLGWDSVSSWSAGLTKDHFDGEVAGHRSGGRDTTQSSVLSMLQEVDDRLKELDEENRRSKAVVDGWDLKMQEMSVMLKQVQELGQDVSVAQGVYPVERLAKDYRIMRQRVHAILWLKELEEEEEKKLGHPLDDSVELLLDTSPEVMPEGWDGTTRDLDEVHYKISKKEDEMLYQEFVQRMNFNKKKMAGEVFRHKFSRRCPLDGWNFTVEKLGSRGKREGGGGGWKFVSMADGSSRPLNDMEKMLC
ncbi:hypothetical protein UlMin_033111 [Ulmus minor]